MTYLCAFSLGMGGMRHLASDKHASTEASKSLSQKKEDRHKMMAEMLGLCLASVVSVCSHEEPVFCSRSSF